VTIGYKIVVPANVPASLNRVLRWHHRRKTKEREMWERTIAALLGRMALKRLRQVSVSGSKMWVRVTIFNPRRYDHDNAFGACKVIFDAIVRLGLAKDDCERDMAQFVLQEKAPGKEKRTQIEIGELERASGDI
jgi:Holliday junction resolvase RusA-like endonuclease